MTIAEVTPRRMEFNHFLKYNLLIIIHAITYIHIIAAKLFAASSSWTFGDIWRPLNDVKER